MTTAIMGALAGLLLVALVALAARYLALRDDLARSRASLDMEQRKTESLSSPPPSVPSVDLEAVTSARTREISELEEKIRLMRSELESVEDSVEIQSFGFYQPHFDFATPEEYRARLESVRADQKSLIKMDQAAHCPTNFTVDGSAARGKKMLKEHVKLMLRAFNGECDAASGAVRYNNVDRLQKRIEKAFDLVNQLGSSKQITITTNYLNLKLDELRLIHEYNEKLQQEKEAQREIREQMRQEQKAEKELRAAEDIAQREEDESRRALEKARAELALTAGAQNAKLEELVARLENELGAALDRKAKAIARAQLTRSGHVYVVSNIGSFGAGIYKIGMTRRFDPLDRINELGTASVPFPFDVHAMIYCEDAPRLEHALHREFDQRRVNKVNNRKEYFRVSLDEIRQAVARNHGIVTFVTVPRAEDFYKTQALEDTHRKQGLG